MLSSLVPDSTIRMHLDSLLIFLNRQNPRTWFIDVHVVELLHSRGSPTKGKKIRSDCVTPAFSGPRRGRNCYVTPAFSGVPNTKSKIKRRDNFFVTRIYCKKNIRITAYTLHCWSHPSIPQTASRVPKKPPSSATNAKKKKHRQQNPKFRRVKCTKQIVRILRIGKIREMCCQKVIDFLRFFRIPL